MKLDFVKGYAEQFYLNAEDGLMQAAKDGADYWYIDGSFPFEYKINWDKKRIDNLLFQIDEFNVKPIYHGNFKLPLASDIESIRELAIKCVFDEVDISSALSSPLIIHGGVIVEPRLVSQAKQEALENYLRSVDKILNYAIKKNVIILLENLSNYKNYRPFHYIFTTPEEYRYIFARINHENAYLFFDVGHGAVCEGDPIAVINEFHNKIWGMSFSNNDGIRDQHLGLKQGIIDFNKVVKAIVDTKWQGIIGFETRGKTLSQSINDLKEIYKKACESGMPPPIKESFGEIV